jgi:hypothetical protein
MLKLTISKYFLFLICCLCLSNLAYSKAARVSLDKKVQECELIAYVEIGTVSTIQHYKLQNAPRKLSQTAEVKIIKSIKGLNVNQTFNLEFNNGLGCPNVTYKQGEKCIIFAKKMKNGNYYTYNTYFGKFKSYPNSLFEGSSFGLKGEVSFKDIKTKILKLIKSQ